MVPQKFQMKDLLKGFQGVMNFAMFRWIFDPLQTFQKSAIFIALMVTLEVWFQNLEVWDDFKL